MRPGSAARGAYPARPLLLRVTPITSAPFVCGPNFHFVQGGVQYTVSLRTSFSTISPFCDNLFAATTFVPFLSSGPPPLDITQGFSLIYSTLFTLNVPAEGTPATAPPSLTVVAAGCTTCHPGNLVAYEVHVTNPGEPVLVEFKTGVRLPGGSTVTILGRHLDKSFATGTTVVPLVSAPLPSGLPSGTYGIEAALLEPELGVRQPACSRSRRPAKDQGGGSPSLRVDGRSHSTGSRTFSMYALSHSFECFLSDDVRSTSVPALDHLCRNPGSPCPSTPRGVG